MGVIDPDLQDCSSVRPSVTLHCPDDNSRNIGATFTKFTHKVYRGTLSAGIEYGSDRH